jgi:hypothetical protein
MLDQKQRRILMAALAAIDERSSSELPARKLFDHIGTAVPDVTIGEVIDALDHSATAIRDEANELRQFANKTWPDKYDYALADEDEYERAHDHEERLTKETAEVWQQVMHDEAGPIPVNDDFIEGCVETVLEGAACDGDNLAQIIGMEVFYRTAQCERGDERESEAFEKYLRARLIQVAWAIGVAKHGRDELSDEQLFQLVRNNIPDISKFELSVALDSLAKTKAKIADMEELDREIEEYGRSLLLQAQAEGSA